MGDLRRHRCPFVSCFPFLNGGDLRLEADTVLTIDLLDVAGERVHVASELQRAPTKFEVRTARHIGEAIDTVELSLPHDSGSFSLDVSSSSLDS
ncbi:880_t:CDS:2 [Ambispora gerdemannii]|uniref:880_t:CDS:1 n=1 Tax=Ambispora gerdemannii TaxID=144530 RepID=A0A9N9BMB8_9GLOM|nr:880_t:CDS:2 [Ambispora gerdemannii]